MSRKLGTRKVDELGRLVLPIEARQRLGIHERQSMDIYLEDDSIVLKSNHDLPCCILCGQGDVDLAEIDSAFICGDCVAKIKAF